MLPWWCYALRNPSITSLRKLFFISALVLPLLAIPSISAAEARSFTSSDGKKLDAELLSATAKDATLKRASDGKEFVLPLDRLSEEDRKFIADWLAAEKAKQEANEKANARAAREEDLSVEKDKTQKVEVPAGKYLSEEGELTLYIGDTVHLEFSAEGKPTVVSEVSKPERTVSFKLSNKDGMTMLNRSTKMQETVAMDCGNLSVGHEEFIRTNLQPTEKGLAVFDSWSGKVWVLHLSNFEVTDRPAADVYNERVNK